MTPAYKVGSSSVFMCLAKPTNSFNNKRWKIYELKILGLKLIFLIDESLVIVDLMRS